MYHFGDAVEHSARLIQSVFVVFRLSHYDVDTPLASPEGKKQGGMNEQAERPSQPDSQ